MPPQANALHFYYYCYYYYFYSINEFQNVFLHSSSSRKDQVPFTTVDGAVVLIVACFFIQLM